jgi:hypothetical protein
VLAAHVQAQSVEPSLLPEDPSQRFVRSGSILLGLSAASTVLATSLMPTQPEDSWGQGIGVGHAIFAAGYAVDGVLHLINARRIARATRRSEATRRNRPVMASSHRWVLWFNFGTAAALTGIGVALSAVPGSDADRGTGVTVVAHGSWLFALAISHLGKRRRGHITWMAQRPGVLQF